MGDKFAKVMMGYNGGAIIDNTKGGYGRIAEPQGRIAEPSPEDPLEEDEPTNTTPPEIVTETPIDTCDIESALFNDEEGSYEGVTVSADKMTITADDGGGFAIVGEPITSGGYLYSIQLDYILNDDELTIGFI